MGSVILGMNKISHDEKIFEMFLYNPPKLKLYNDRDVEILCGLELKNGFLQNYLNICKTSKVNYEFTGNYPKVKRDFLIMCHEHKYYRSQDKTWEEKQEQNNDTPHGAFVAKPKSGVYDDIIAVDIGSLYPSAIAEHNICISTFINPDDFDKWNMKDTCNPINNARYRKDRVGFIPRMFETVNRMRKYYKGIQTKLKEEGKIGSNEFAVAESLEYAWKAKGLSIYGVLGLNSSILYNFDMVESVTLTGIYFLTQGIKYLFGDDVYNEQAQYLLENNKDNFLTKNFGESVGKKGIISDVSRFIYMDTDSYYLKVIKYKDKLTGELRDLSELERGSEEYVDAIYRTGSEIVDICHQKYEEIAEQQNAMKKAIWLDFEQIYSRMLFMDTKKKYCGNLCWHKGTIIQGDKISYKGMELKKRDGISLAKKWQEEILRDIILDKTDSIQEQKRIIDCREFVLGNKEQKPTFEEICKTGKVTKHPEEYDTPSLPLPVRMYIKEQEEGKQVSIGSSIHFVVTRGEKEGEYASEGVTETEFHRILKESGELIYDKIYYWNAIYKPLQRVLECAYKDVNWDVFGIKKQAKKVSSDIIDREVKQYLENNKKQADLFTI
jgi:DNA polymerase elongation subunit (family B)